MIDRHACPVGNCCFYLQSRRKMDAEGSSAMLVHIFQITKQNFPEPINLHSQYSENLRCH